MHNSKAIEIDKKTKIVECLKVLDQTNMQICLVVNNNRKLLGTVCDGDIRRGILNGFSLEDTVDKIMCSSPVFLEEGFSKTEIFNIMSSKKIRQLPIVNHFGFIEGIELLEDLFSQTKRLNRVILMVGGLGERLRPLTKSLPKPMLSVGGRPILQTIIESLVEHGFVKATLCLGYKSEKIKDFFGDGSKFNIEIDYILEDKRMGTAGALDLIADEITDPFILMNGDLLTNINFSNLIDFHINTKASVTMCIKEKEFQVPYGVIEIDDERIISINEKPVQSLFINAGIYVLDPDVMKFIPNNKFYDMNSLITRIIEEDKLVSPFPITEYWIDIGRFEEYEKANEEFEKIFKSN